MELLRVSAGQRLSQEAPVTEECYCSYARMKEMLNGVLLGIVLSGT